MIVLRYLGRTGLLFGLLLFAITASMATIRVTVNGRALSFRVPPTQVRNRTMVPMRTVFQSLGAQVNWNASTQRISATRGNTDVQLGIGNHNATSNGRAIYIDEPAMIRRGSTLVPLRFVSEALGADVKWFEATQTVSITSGYESVANTNYGDNGTDGQYAGEGISDSDVRNLVAPIALYPDPLLAIILPASTYPEQVSNAARMHLGNNERAIDRQNWDISVKALAHYPNLLQKLANDLNWTAAVGQVYVAQPQDVMDAIQLLRRQARNNGVLQSTRQQRVYLEGNYVRVVPAQSNLIYVPQYNPAAVYVQHRPNHGTTLLAFGIGLVIGSWLSNDTDWAHHRVYNHGWQGNGWIANSRPHVTIINIYTDNKNRPPLVNYNVNRRQVNLQKVRNYNLPRTFAPQVQAPARQIAPRTITPRPVAHPNVQRPTISKPIVQRYQAQPPTRPTYTRPTPNRNLPAVPDKPGQIHTAKPLAARQPLRQLKPNNNMSDRQMPGNKKAGPAHTQPVIRPTAKRSTTNNRSAQKVQPIPVARPTFTRPTTSRNQPTASTRRGQDNAVKQSSSRQSRNQPAPKDATSGKQKHGNNKDDQQHKTAGNDHNSNTKQERKSKH